MPTLKTNVKGVDTSQADAYAPYDGPAPTPGFYTAVPQSVKVALSSNNNPMVVTVFKLKANKADNPTKKQFDGYPVFDRVTIGEHDALKVRLANYLLAMVGDDAADIIHDAIDDGGKVTKIGRRKIETLLQKQEVRLLLKMGNYNGESRIECDGARPWEPATGVSGTVAQNASVGKAATSQRDEAELPGDTDAGDEDEADESGEEEWDRSERLAELNDASLPDLKALAKEYELEVKGPRPKIVTAILDYEEENFDSEADEEQDEVDAEEAARDELSALPLAKLKTLASTLGVEAKGPKSKWFEELLEAYVSQETAPEEDEEAAEEDEEIASAEEELREELATLTLPKLRGRAAKAGANTNGPKGKLIDAIVAAELGVEEGTEELSKDSPIEDLIGAIAAVDGYSEEDFEGYGEDERDELVELLTEEGVLSADTEEDPF